MWQTIIIADACSCSILTNAEGRQHFFRRDEAWQELKQDIRWTAQITCSWCQWHMEKANRSKNNRVSYIIDHPSKSEIQLLRNEMTWLKMVLVQTQRWIGVEAMKHQWNPQHFRIRIVLIFFLDYLNSMSLQQDKIWSTYFYFTILGSSHVTVLFWILMRSTFACAWPLSKGVPYHVFNSHIHVQKHWIGGDAHRWEVC